MEEWVLSVGQLNEYVRRSLAADPMLKRVKLRGEISNFKRHTSGHLYFSLKDEEARIACVMFRSSADSLRLRPMDGMRVVLGGQAGLYARTVAIKATYSDMKQVTRQHSGEETNSTSDIYRIAAMLLGKIEKRPLRLIGIYLSGLTKAPCRQMSLLDGGDCGAGSKKGKFGDALLALQQKHGRGIVKPASVLQAERSVGEKQCSQLRKP